MKNTEDSIYNKEVELLQKSVITTNKMRGKKNLESSIIKRIINIIENYLKEKKYVCYGGTAINNILPKSKQFYKKNIELPDYDFFSPNAFNDSKLLAEYFYDEGFDEVETKSGVHYGTYKVFVNFISIADITQMDLPIFNILQKNSILVNHIYYADPNYLRMAGYLELSRPNGDNSRWEKVFHRISLLNKYYPINEKNCLITNFINSFYDENINNHDIFNIIKNTIINEKGVFFGGFALKAYSKYYKSRDKKNITNFPLFYILSEDPKKLSNNIKKSLNINNIKNISIKEFGAIGEIIPRYFTISISNNIVVSVYETIACHSYNNITINNEKIKIASIETMFSLYLAFLFNNNPDENYDPKNILCIADYLFKIQANNRLKKSGILKRFPSDCYGYQNTLEDIRGYKSVKYKELKQHKHTNEYKKHFLRYYPLEIHNNNSILEKSKCLKKNSKSSKKKSNKTIKKSNKTIKKSNKTIKKEK